jgi:hypothetical protein
MIYSLALLATLNSCPVCQPVKVVQPVVAVPVVQTSVIVPVFSFQYVPPCQPQPQQPFDLTRLSKEQIRELARMMIEEMKQAKE